MFPKTDKRKFNKNSLITLDSKHKEITNEFHNNDTLIIPRLKFEKKQLNEKLLSDSYSLEKRLDMKDQLNDIQDKIRQLNYEKKQYFKKNAKLIFNYFENKKDISDGKTNTETKNVLLEKFFKINKSANHTNPTSQAENENIVNKYLSNIDNSFLDLNSYVYASDICSYCYKGELIPNDEEGLLLCSNCYHTLPYLTENEKPSYKEQPKEISFYAYKRINHFKEILSQIQGKETTQIPSEVIVNIQLQVKKERLSLDQITNDKTKDILKKLGYNKYYEHIPFIKDKLGVKPPIMSPELEEILCNLFIELQAPYSKYCPKDRVNFLNYYYTIYKLCELLEEKTYLPHFPMLKDKDKRVQQDEIWEKICEDLDWKFIPTP